GGPGAAGGVEAAWQPVGGVHEELGRPLLCDEQEAQLHAASTMAASSHLVAVVVHAVVAWLEVDAPHEPSDVLLDGRYGADEVAARHLAAPLVHSLNLASFSHAHHSQFVALPRSQTSASG